MCNIRILEVIGYVSFEIYNVLCGLVVCVILYSCYLNCGNLVDFLKIKKDVVVMGIKVSDNFYRNNSGGRVWFLYFILVENFFLGYGVMEKSFL